MVRLLSTSGLEVPRLGSEPVFSGSSAATAELQRYINQIRVGKPGKCAHEPTLLINGHDNSGSVVGGNDPVGRRFIEDAIAIQRVGTKCKCGKDLVATIHFDTPTSGDLKPTPITRDHFDEIRASLAIPADGAGISCLLPTLAAARAIVAQHPRHRPIVVIHTDFELFDNYLPQLLSFPGDVHAVVLRAEPPAELLAAPKVTVTRVGYDSPPGTVARAVFRALTTARVDAKPLLPEGQRDRP